MTRFETRLPIRGLRAALRSAVLLAIGAGLFGALGCANGEIRLGDPFDRELSLEESQHRYTVLVRWSDFQRAKAFVAESDRDAFIERMKSLDEARFTDYESDSIDLDDDKHTATLRVVYTLYMPSSPFETEVAETQVWERDGVTNFWTVTSTFDALPAIASN
jgi:hypothetical protein